ncbi:MAG: NAD+ synthase [Pseudomonadota bacterium]
MTDTFSIAIAQLNPVVGDIAGNLEKARAAWAEAARKGADLIVFSELFLSGYPPEDLVLKPAFQRAVKAAAEALAQDTAKGGPAILIGAPWRDGQNGDAALYNAALYLAEGRIQDTVYKTHLPNYGVFDEIRVFAEGAPSGPIKIGPVNAGVIVCEDMWRPGPWAYAAEQGAELMIVLNGSPFRDTAHAERFEAVRERMAVAPRPLLYVNQMSGQDEIVFDGASFTADETGAVTARAPDWAEGVFLTSWEKANNSWRLANGPQETWTEGLEMIYQALVLGVKDYVNKNRFPGVLIGLSGGIDSALTAAIAVDALGADRVRCVMMPSKYTSQESLEDAALCAKALGVDYDSISIEDAVTAFDSMLTPAFEGRDPDVTEENIQSRIRGVILMALSNKFGHMVLTTGNKSEMSVGYATLYGDMNGGFNALKDVYKTQVFALSRWRNEHQPKDALGPEGEVIPVRIIDKPPSAELREDQKDEDSLPPYEVLDDILDDLVEYEMSVSEIVALGFDEAVVRRIEHLLYIAEYKRRQAPPGTKVTAKNFGRDRRYPITNGFRDR